MAAITEACHASQPSGYCTGTGCGLTNDTLIKYPFRLVGDADNERCYTYFTELHFVCLNNLLYLNITPYIDYSYQVLNINYTNQTLDVMPVGNSWCQPFNPNEFSRLNVTNISGNSSLLLECNTSISVKCSSNTSSPSSPTCPSRSGRYSCPFQPGQYGNYSCYLYQVNTTIQLAWQGDFSSMFQNLIYHIICSICSFWFGL